MTKRKRKTVGYTVHETEPGCINITCDRSGRPFTRSTALGMFCDQPCECERLAKAAPSQKEVLDFLMNMVKP